MYEPFCADFGPLNLGNTFRFCQKLSSLLKVQHSCARSACLTACRPLTFCLLLQTASTTGKPVCFYCGPSLTKRANAAVLVRLRAL